ncbi:unnamed protein product [Protopolystoma xenopodis]|uniref:CUB domain-containing protein n=1 Tax=Protopolystoma xenopodis TaxID=117903 RepID=A0A3S5AED6_9PLAT|nr:unnamed protein product [Protopolystoma xenopodis]
MKGFSISSGYNICPSFCHVLPFFSNSFNLAVFIPPRDLLLPEHSFCSGSYLEARAGVNSTASLLTRLCAGLSTTSFNRQIAFTTGSLPYASSAFLSRRAEDAPITSAHRLDLDRSTNLWLRFRSESGTTSRFRLEYNKG